MSIRVHTKKLAAWRSDLPDQIKVDMVNAVVEDFATEVRNELGKLKCPRHPSKVSTVTITADRVSTMVIKKKFCCPEFEKKVSLKLER
jgi:hypothetical protein